MRCRSTRIAAAAVLMLALVGCAEAPPVTRLPPSASGPVVGSSVEPTVASTADLPALKAAAGIADCPASDPDVPAVTNGLPDAVLPCLGGGRSVRLAGLRGRPVVLNLWAQWCGPCRAEAPFLAELAGRAERGGSDLMVLGVDFHDPYPDRALEFAQAAGWRYPQLQDADDAFAALQVTAPPVTLLVRADGTIAARHSGPFRSTDELAGLVREQLGVSL